MLIIEYSDKELAVLLSQDNQGAFRYIFEKWHKKLYHFCIRYLNNPEQSEETVHDTLIKLWTTRHHLDPNQSLEGLLYTICKRLCLNRLREATRVSAAAEELWVNYMDQNNSTEEFINLVELQEFTDQAVLKLTKQQQLVFTMSRYEGLSQQEIAERLNISKETVKKHSAEALKALRLEFNNYFHLLAFFMLFNKF
ncbi:RNA polymerase sigma factor [Sphingobacterium multivorum]|uniref:RNA polymerase sigma factor n=1 Tax=Sphingobacterium multivorum TaxID=28454 RepID=UPI003DA68EF1